MKYKTVTDGLPSEVLREACQASILLRGMMPQEIGRMLEASAAQLLEFAKGDFVFHQEEEVRFVYILVSGMVAVCKDSEDGRRHIVTRIETPGDLFAEVYAFIPAGHYDYYVEAQQRSLVLAIPKEYFGGRSVPDPQREQVMSNMLSVLASKAYYLNSRLYVLGGGSIREKVLRLLEQSDGSSRGGQRVMTREQMADSLGVSRPALSRELMKMVDDGLIFFDGKAIRIVRR